MDIDEQALQRDLAGLPFSIGERRGKWALLGCRFPYVLFFIAAAPRNGGPPGFLLRSECTGYRAAAPTSQLWHGGADQALPQANRPKKAAGVITAFQDWASPCLYHPIDRLARPHWPNQYADMAWSPDKEITFLLETVYGLVQSAEYVGADLPEAALAMPASFMAVHPPRAA